ncbi:MAG: hypothetical protein RL095_2514 [Verrucomicrobiota bacterium]|jgi:hypothetical protein
MQLSHDQIQSMSLQEKILAMESLWQDLRQAPENLVLPDWHEAELRETEARLARGEEEFLDWDQVEAELRLKWSDSLT